MANELTTAERSAKAELVGVVSRGQKTFVEVGTALARLRNEKLYRDTDKTFDAFCRREWGYSRSYAHRLIEAADISEMLPIGNKPKTASQARELKKTPPEKRVAAMSKAKAAAKNPDNVTAVEVRRAVAEVTVPPPAEHPAAEPWLEYNAIISRVVGILEEGANLTIDAHGTTFGSWIDPKQHATFWKNAITQFEKHAVHGWRPSPGKDQKPFLYEHEVKHRRVGVA